MNPLEHQIEKGKSKGFQMLRSADDIEEIVSHVVALLNSGGGTVVAGVDGNGRIIGVPGASSRTKKLAVEIRKSISPKALFSVNAENVAGFDLLVVEVPGGRDIPFVAEGKVYLRRGAQTVLATGDDLHRIFQERAPDTVRWERRGSPVLEIECLDEAEITKTVQTAQAESRFSFRNPSEPEAVLDDLGLRNQGLLTNACDVCLGMTPAARNPQVRLRAYAFQSDKRGDFIDQADLSGPVAQVIAQATAFIQRNSSLAAQFLPDSNERHNLPAYPAFAVREGLVNALAHRDYSGFSSGATLQVFPDRVEIWNSGKLPAGWNAGKLHFNHPSLPANPDIAHFLYIRNLMERIGRGTLKMIDACDEVGLPRPAWKVDEDGITLTLHSLASRVAPLMRLNERQRKVIESLKSGEQLQLGDYIERFAGNVSERQAQRDLRALQEFDLLRLQGKGRSAFYVRTERRLGT